MRFSLEDIDASDFADSFGAGGIKPPPTSKCPPGSGRPIGSDVCTPYPSPCPAGFQRPFGNPFGVCSPKPKPGAGAASGGAFVAPSTSQPTFTVTPGESAEERRLREGRERTAAIYKRRLAAEAAARAAAAMRGPNMMLPTSIAVTTPLAPAPAPAPVPFYKKPIVIAGGVLAIGTLAVVFLTKE